MWGVKDMRWMVKEIILSFLSFIVIFILYRNFFTFEPTNIGITISEPLKILIPWTSPWPNLRQKYSWVPLIPPAFTGSLLFSCDQTLNSHFPLLGLSFSFLFILPLRVVPAIVVVVQANQWFSPSSPLLVFYPLVPSFFLFIPHGKSLYIVVFVKGKSPRAFTYNASSCYGWSSKNPL